MSLRLRVFRWNFFICPEPMLAESAGDRLDRDIIRTAIDPMATFEGLEVFTEIDSTNQYFLTGTRQGMQGPRCCLAEYQTAGRGRQGKTWHSPFGSGLCLSVLWSFAQDPGRLMGLSLAMGTIVAEVLEACGIPGVVGLKWPNDLYWSGRKLAGLLIEVVARTGGPTHCVIGLGLNVHVPAGTLEAVDQPWIDLATTGWYPLPTRNYLAAAVLSGLSRALYRFESEGLASFLDAWRHRDILVGQALTVQTSGGQMIDGFGAGITSSGALQVQTVQEIKIVETGLTFLRK